MKTLWNNSNYGNDLKLTRQDVNYCSQSGDMENNVLETIKKPYVKKQLQKLDPEKLAKELKEFGAWDETQLKDHNENLLRWVWLSACDISERN